MVSNSLTYSRLGFRSVDAPADSPMLIVCPSCATSYDVDPTSLSSSGRQVRCLRCRAVWRAEPSHADKLTLAAAALAPDADDATHGAEETLSEPAKERSSVDARSLQWAAAEVPEETSIAPDFEEHNDVAAAHLAADRDYSADVDAPPIAPLDLDRDRSEPVDEEPDASAYQAEDIESVAARRQQRRNERTSLRWPLSPWQTGLLALALADIILLGWRSDVVRALPQTASFYSSLGMPVNLRNLTFNDVRTSMEQHEGVPILVVEGNVINAARKSEDMPRLKFIVRNAAHQEIYSWTAVPSRASLAPGEAVGFRSRLASPPASAHDLVLRFVTRRDVVVGGR
jgi:predicted Zn finger-like uncharacterized protein